MKRDDKGSVIESLAEEMAGAQAMLVADYRGLTVAQVAEVRGALRESGATFRVAKNTLTRIAAERSGKAELVELLQGPTAITFATDDVPGAAKRLQEAARTTRVLAVRGGLVEGRLLGADEVRRIADLPSREVILAEAVGAVASPLQAAASVISAPLRDLVMVLDAYIAKRQEAEASA